jgi:hypothetical protein
LDNFRVQINALEPLIRNIADTARWVARFGQKKVKGLMRSFTTGLPAGWQVRMMGFAAYPSLKDQKVLFPGRGFVFLKILPESFHLPINNVQVLAGFKK